MENSAFEVAFIHDFVHEIGGKVLPVVLVGIALNDFGDKQAGFDSVVHQVEEKVKVLEHVVLAVWVVVAALKEEVDHCLEEFFVVEFLENQSL